MRLAYRQPSWRDPAPGLGGRRWRARRIRGSKVLLLRVSRAREKNPMKLKPLGDRVVVEREEAKTTTAGGIVLPDTAKDKPQKGKIIAVGDGRVTKDGKRRELQVKVGDQVLFTSYAGDEFKL